MFNNFFEKTYVINLAEATDRKKHVSNLLSSENISFEFFEAFNGRKNLPTDESRLDFAKKNFWNCPSGWTPSVGQIGCWMSHVNIWQHIVENNIETCLILEDDITFGVDDPNETLNSNFKDLPKNWNIFMLGFCNYNGYKVFSGDIVKPTMPACTHAYVLKKQAAEILLEHYFPMRGALDFFTGHIFFSNENEETKKRYETLFSGNSWGKQKNLKSLDSLFSYGCAPCIFNQGGSSYSSVW